MARRGCVIDMDCQQTNVANMELNQHVAQTRAATKKIRILLLADLSLIVEPCTTTQVPTPVQEGKYSFWGETLFGCYSVDS